MISSCICKLLGKISEYSVYNLISSANSLAVVLESMWSVTSFMKILNSKDPITLPWITPLETGHGEERVEFILTDWDRLVRKDLIQK